MYLKKLSIGVLLSAIIVLLCLFACEKKDAAKPADEAKKEQAAKAAKKKTDAPKGVWIKLSEDDKQYLLRVGRKAFDLYVKEKKRYMPEDIPPHLVGMKSNRIFATIYKQGDWRGCVSDKERDIVRTVVGSVINTVNDRRFKDPKPDELEDFRLELSILQPMEEITTKDPEQIKKELEPGVHGIQVAHVSGKRAFFLPYVFVKRQRSTETWLQRLSRKAGMDKDGWKTKEARIWRYNTINFIEDKPYGKAVDLYRYRVEIEELTKPQLEVSFVESKLYYMEHLDKKTNRFLAGYDSLHRRIESGLPTLQLWSLVALANAKDLPEDKSVNLSKLIDNGVEAVLPNIKKAKGDGEAIFFKEEVDFEATLLWALFLAETDDIKEKKKRLMKVIDHLATYGEKSEAIPKRAKSIPDIRNFAVYVLYRLAEESGHEMDKAMAKKWFDAYWRSDGVWSLSALALAAKVTGDKALLDRSIELAVHKLDKQYTKKSAPYSDYIGAFKTASTPRTVMVAAELHGLALLYEQIRKSHPDTKKRVMHGLFLGLRWLMEQQFNAVNSFYLEGYTRYLGAYRHNILTNATKLDDTSLGFLSAMKIFLYAWEDFEANLDMLNKELNK